MQMQSFFKSGIATDPEYCITRDGCAEYQTNAREYLEHIWRECAPYVDSDAAEKATRDLSAVYWELQLAYALKSSGKNLVPRKHLAYKSNEGPDLFVENHPGTWLEAVVVRPGRGPDALQYHDPAKGKIQSYNTDGVILRLRSVIRDKSIKIQKYISAEIVKPNQPVVIAISGLALPYRLCPFVDPPAIVRSVYPVNNQVIELDLERLQSADYYLEYRDHVRKSLGAEVATDLFLDPQFSHISAVLYDEAHWLDPPSRLGAHFKLVHNLMAAMPLPDGWLPVGIEYWWRDGARLEGRPH